ncbi:LLM class flavin-dependent oxidoreductase [Antrihabitans sp. YC2-6]|uniref:LLM class flavin-dependent oxidoreductase n=1 Tax=Antrihabitans sp. YC2-6 TaxID=2799498 RepID=UPI0018F531D4|nr:LLM class flavin-dependent oxidoreductase [Antrihabitans sp. YC2-6]MBJ8347077.1 LLM class flavin-dependent oxidoreductase [Antrihabitans sp. YC2-6]
MKVNYFQQVPYRQLPDDFEQRYESVVTTPYFDVTTSDNVIGAFRQSIDELMHAARAGFDGLLVTEHGQSSYDMAPNPNIVESAVAYATEIENIATAIYPVGRSLGKSREPIRVAEELAMIDAISSGRLVSGFPVGLAYDANINNGVPPAQTRQRFDENLELVLKAWTEREAFPWNGRFAQHAAVNIWPRPIQQAPHPPVWITGIGNPKTMQMTIDREFGFNYFGWFGLKVTGRRIFDRFWELLDKSGKDANPYRLGFMQTICVADTDAKAEALYAKHAEYFFQKGIGSIPMQRLALPGGIDIRGVEAIMRDPGDFGIYNKMRTASFADLVDAGSVICGSPDTVAEQLIAYAREYRIGNLHAMLQFGSMPHDLAKDNIDLFASAVMPRLKQVWDDEGHEHHWWPESLGGRPLATSPNNLIGALA